MSQLNIHPVKGLSGTLSVPGDKSISHRAFLIGALAKGTAQITHSLFSDDVITTRRAMQLLGVTIQMDDPDATIHGVGIDGLRQPSAVLDMGNSGTTTRLLMGILAGASLEVELDGDASLRKRPMRRVTDLLEQMGVGVTGAPDKNYLPLKLQGGQLKGGTFEPTVASAQVKSALLLAGLSADAPVVVTQKMQTRDHTERLLRYLGAEIDVGQDAITVVPNRNLLLKDMDVPGDFSSAAFFLVAGSIVPNAKIQLERVGLNATRTGLLTLLKRMGANIEVLRSSGDDWEPRGDVLVSSAQLKGIEVEPEIVPNVIDELPILMVAATQAEGTTKIYGVEELRVKETDRVESMLTGLRQMGANIGLEGEDTVVIEGPTPLEGATVSSFGDHRTAMAHAVAGLCAKGPTVIDGAEWVRISYPGFEEALKSLTY